MEKQLEKDYHIRIINNKKICLSLTEKEHKLVMQNRNQTNKWLIHINKMIKTNRFYHLINHSSMTVNVNATIYTKETSYLSKFLIFILAFYNNTN